MISTEIRTINNIGYYPDSQLPGNYYYLPASPGFKLKNGVPLVKLYEYRGNDIAGGLITLETDLLVSQDELNKAKKELNASSIAPLPVVGGNASLGFPGSPGETVNISMMGDNSAIFYKHLDQKETSLLEGIMKKSATGVPMFLVYNIDYIALRPPGSYKITANWEQVQTYIKKQYSINLFFVRIDISKIVMELVEKKDIIIEATNIDTDRRTAIREIEEMLLSTFFKPVFPPITQRGENAGNQAPYSPGFSFCEVDIKQIDKRYLEFNMQETSVVRRRAFPQATFGDMAAGTRLENHIEQVELESAFYKNRTITVQSGVDFIKNKISSILVSLTYGENNDTAALTASAPLETRIWPSFIKEKKMIRDVSYRYEINFNSIKNDGWPDAISSGNLTTTWDNLQVMPENLYTLHPVSVYTLKSFHWEWYDHVEVNIRFERKYVENGKKEGTSVEKKFILTETKNHVNWDMFVADGFNTEFTYQLKFYPKSDQPRHQSYRPSVPSAFKKASDCVIISDPYPQRTVEVIPQFSRENIREVHVFLKYASDQDGEGISPVKFIFDGANDTPQTFSADQPDPALKTVNYYQITYFKTGKPIQGSPVQTIENKIVLTDAGK